MPKEDNPILDRDRLEKKEERRERALVVLAVVPFVFGFPFVFPGPAVLLVTLSPPKKVPLLTVVVPLALLFEIVLFEDTLRVIPPSRDSRLLLRKPL